MTSHRRTLALSALILAGIALLSFAAPANAQDGYPATGTITLDKTEVEPGGSVAVSCTGFAPGTPVEVYLHSDPILLGTVNAGEDGTITFDAEIPANTPTGPHTLECRGTGQDGNALSLSAQFTVVSATTATTTSGTLPRTGSDSTNLVRIGIVLIVAGAALAVVVRRRKRESAHA